MTDNLKLWDSVRKIDPKHTKAITGRDYQGTSPNFTALIQMATEKFGPCGIGFGWIIENERYVELGQIKDTPARELLHVVQVCFWYELDGKRGEVRQMGQTKLYYITGKGYARVDEDAPKKSVTDAITKCMACIGFAADIHLGRYDDNKYVQQVNSEFREAEQASQPKADSKPDPNAYATMLKGKINGAGDVDKLNTVWAANKAGMDKLHSLSQAAHQSVTDAYNIRMGTLSQAPDYAPLETLDDIPF